MSPAVVLATPPLPGLPPMGHSGNSAGMLELVSTQIELDAVRPGDLAPGGVLVATTSQARAQFTGGALVVSLPGIAIPAIPPLTRSIGTLWRWSPPDGDFSRRPSIRARLVSPTGVADQLTNATNPDQVVHATLSLRPPVLNTYQDSMDWSGDGEITIAAGELAGPGTYHGRIEIISEAF